MKRVSMLILAFFLCISIAFAESGMTFSSLPWLLGESSVESIVCSVGLQMESNTIISNDHAVYFVADDTLGYQPTFLPELSDVCIVKSMDVMGKIAGYPIKDIILCYAYDGTMKLISMEIKFIRADYESLLTKITRAYGEAETCIIEDEGIISNLWRYNDKSGILLYTESEGAEYTLLYGRLDAVDILNNCLCSDPEDISGL